MDNQASRPTRPTALRVGVSQTFLIGLTLLAVPAAAQTLIAVDDSYGVRYAQPLVVEAPGVIDNDTYNGGPAAGAGATVTLIGPPSFGTLECDSDPVAYDLCPDGSFSYSPGPGFPGFDSFSYEAAVGGTTDQATVFLSACTGGPTRFVCWQEAAYLAKLGELGYSSFSEGFEDDLVWGVTRFPLTEPSVLSQGVRWWTNHPDPPALNELTTGNGPAHTGLWGVYDPEHGYATGTPEECDITNPPDHCLFKDGVTGTREGGGAALVGVGGYFMGSLQPNLTVILDGGAPIGLGMLSAGAEQYFGVIDTGGFTSFRFEETDGKVGQERYVFADDFTLATATADTTPPRVVLVSSVDDTGDGVLAEAEATDAFIIELLVYYSEPVQDLPGDTDPHDVTNPANYLLINDGGNGFQTVNCAGGVAVGDVEVTVDAISYTSGSVLEAVVLINGGLGLPLGSYRLLVCGTTSIRDWAGNALDGNGNGTGGDDFVRNFSIIPPVNDPPVANPQSVSTPEDTAKVITLTGTDPNGDPLTFAIVTPPAHGALTGTPPSVTYTPPADYHGPDSFTFTVNDGTVTSAPATVSITVTAVNDPPVANPQAVTTPEDTAKAITLTASDIDFDSLSYSIVTGPAHGALTGTPPSVTYTPVSNYNGPDSFTFRAWDGQAFSTPATVSITVTAVNDPPVANPQEVTTPEDTATPITLTGSDPDGTPLTYSIVTPPSNGTLTGAPPSVTYTPTNNYHGLDSFTFTVNDGTVTSAPATVSITVTAVNDPPVANPQAVTTPEDTARAITLTASDIDFDALTYSIVTPPAHGALTGTPPDVTYTPATNYNGPDSFSFRAWDGQAFSAPATVSITVTEVNDPPAANPQSVTTPQNTAVAITLTGSDPEGSPLSYAIGTGPAHGSLTGTPPSVTYTPATSYVGPDAFTFTVNDGALTSAPATVSITVTDTPLSVLTIGNASIIEGDAGPVSVNVTITLTPASTIPVSVSYATGGGTATAGSDYTAASGTADFPIGATTAVVPIDVLGDLLDEPDEGFGVSLSSPVGAVLGTPSTGTVTIIDDDPMPDLSGADVVVFESVGQAVVELTLSAASGFDITVDYVTANGTATAPADYGAVSGTAFIAAGALSTTVPIAIVNDPDIEPDESFTLELSNPGNAVLLTPSITVTIRDDDGTLLFEDGFDSGDLSHWSAVVP